MVEKEKLKKSNLQKIRIKNAEKEENRKFAFANYVGKKDTTRRHALKTKKISKVKQINEVCMVYMNFNI